MNPQEKTIVAIPESIELNGQTYVVKDTPELMAFRVAVAQAEKSKLHSTFETLRAQIKTLQAANVVQSSAPFDMDALLSAMEHRFVTRDDLKGTIGEVIQPILSATEQQRIDDLNQYRERLIRDNEASCIPELVKGNSKEELEKSLKESIELRAKYNSPVMIPGAQQQRVVDPLIAQKMAEMSGAAPAAPAPAPVPATPAPAPAPAPAMPEVPSRAVPEVSQGPNLRQMTMDEFQQKREQLLHQLEAEFGNK